MTTFGPTLAEIQALADRIRALGAREAFEEWIDGQFALPPTYHHNIAKAMLAYDGYVPTPAPSPDEPYYPGLRLMWAYSYKHRAWWHVAMTAPDQLRQRVAWALAQIFVVGDPGVDKHAGADPITDKSEQRSHYEDYEPRFLGTVDYYDMLVWSYGAAIVLPANAFGVSILKAADDHRGTLIYGSPTHYDLMTHDPDGQLPETLRLAVVTTARLRPELAERFRARFGRGLNETYGIIEIGLPAINYDGTPAHQGSVGRVLPAYSLKLAPTDEADPDASGTPTGEVLLHGPGLLDAYYDPWRPRAEILAARGGWLATGDLGRLDADGYLTLVGRAKELISVGGMKFFPQEVERVLEQYPGISEACVYGISHPRDGEQPHADLVLEPTVAAQPDPAALEAHCREVLAPYKVPQRFRVVAALPRTASGKLLRRGPRPPERNVAAANAPAVHGKEIRA